MFQYYLSKFKQSLTDPTNGTLHPGELSRPCSPECLLKRAGVVKATLCSAFVSLANDWLPPVSSYLVLELQPPFTHTTTAYRLPLSPLLMADADSAMQVTVQVTPNNFPPLPSSPPSPLTQFCHRTQSSIRTLPRHTRSVDTSRANSRPHSTMTVTQVTCSSLLVATFSLRDGNADLMINQSTNRYHNVLPNQTSAPIDHHASGPHPGFKRHAPEPQPGTTGRA